jgi:hypothetical protein
VLAWYYEHKDEFDQELAAEAAADEATERDWRNGGGK